MKSERLAPYASHAAALATSIVIGFVGVRAADAAEPSPINSMSVDELKDAYLACEHAAKNSRLNGGDVMYCSLIYEELKERAFEGEFIRIKSWLDLRSRPMG